MRGCRPLDDSEVSAAIAAIDGPHQRRDKALFLVCLRAGLRIEEALALKVRDAWDGTPLPYLNLPRRICKGKWKGASLPLHKEAAAAIADYLSIERPGALPGEPLFLSRKRNKMQPMDPSAGWRRFKRIFSNAGIRGGTLATHTGRKTFCRRVHNLTGHDLIATAAAMRSTVGSVISYLQADSSRVESAILA